MHGSCREGAMGKLTVLPQSGYPAQCFTGSIEHAIAFISVLTVYRWLPLIHWKPAIQRSSARDTVKSLPLIPARYLSPPGIIGENAKSNLFHVDPFVPEARHRWGSAGHFGGALGQFPGR